MDANTWDLIRACKRWGTAPDDAGSPIRTVHLFSPLDEVHQGIVLLVKSVGKKLGSLMYGWDDQEIDNLFRSAWISEHIAVKVGLDATQAAGRGETPLLKQWPADCYGSELVIGQSSKKRISHDKLIVADDAWLGGSTNLSDQGERLQNNEAFFVWNATSAIEIHALVDLVFDQMAKAPGALTHKTLLGT